jgi:Asp-tRNA(Asn)/Glu-tRNA(Gln) amidotransferase A subunit family amidase
MRYLLNRRYRNATGQTGRRRNSAGQLQRSLHGIPYGLKDLFAVKGTHTTWGAAPYKNQVIDEDSYVYTRLKAAGAVLVAKFTLGALALGDNWYGGRTNNPWNLKTGSSGSSAGSTAATVAGLVPFAIGTETFWIHHFTFFRMWSDWFTAYVWLC